MFHLSELLLFNQYHCLFIVLLDLDFISFLTFAYCYLIITTKIQFSQCSISFQCFTYLSCSFWSNTVVWSLFYWIWTSFHSFVYCYLDYILSAQSRFSLVNVVLVSNDSLTFIAPSSPIPLSVHCKEWKHLSLWTWFSLSTT